MSTDYREKEREFLDSLKEDTGRDLSEWMAAISQQQLPHRNDIIDWLRQQGFMFSKASWLERVHHNGGKPIYSDAVVARRAMPKRNLPADAIAPAHFESVATSTPADPAPQLAAVRQPEQDALEKLLASAKAYRPLAQHILREVTKAVSGATTAAAGTYVSVSRDGKEFAVLAIGTRELRLGLALSGHPLEPPLVMARFPNPAVKVPTAITHMAILNDVRQFDGALMAWIAKAAAKSVAAA